MARSLRSFAIAALFLLLAGTALWAQATAEISGRVTDESGAVLPGVTVTATQTDTGFTRTVVTDASGVYVMPSLPTGPYRLEVSLQGFRTYVQTGIVLQVAGAPVIVAVLALGSVEETVTVEGASPLVDTQSSGISQVVEQERILELPLQGRQVTDLIVLAGAAVQTGTPPSHHFAGGVRIGVAGGQTFGVAYLLDGAVHNDLQSSGGMPLPFPDALQEFRVATSGLSAENGLRSGASVNAVTKSGTNRFHGNLFEFYRDKRFNAISRFAALRPDGKRKDDGLLRHQFGGTLGGPIVRDKLFFFGGYQHTAIRQAPNDNVTFVPTAAMLAGDFTAITSPACNSGRQIPLRTPFVSNRVDPALFNLAALQVTKLLPAAINECGETRFVTGGAGAGRNEGQLVARFDYQRGPNHSLFARYMTTFHKQGVPATDNIISAQHQTNVGLNNWATSVAFGDTRVSGANTVNAFRVAFNRTSVDRFNIPAAGPEDLGIKASSYEPHRMNMNVAGAFNFGTNAGYGITSTEAFNASNDLTMVRGRHEIGLGASVAYWNTYIETCARCGGQWDFNGQVTGLGLADFLLGRLAVLEHGGPGGTDPEQWHVGLFAQDAWRATSRVTLNMGLRWEPFFGQHLQGRFGIPIWSWDNFRQGVRSTQFVNAPPGFLYAGDPGFPPGRSGMNKQWWNLSPRVGAAWDVTGDGRMSVRASYGLAYDFPVSDFYFLQASAPPFGNRLRLDFPPGGFDNPYGHLGGDPHPIVTSRNTVYPPGGAFGVMEPDINSPRVQSWNVTVERQVGVDWGVAISYLGNYTDRLWDLVPLNPAVFMELGPCTLNGVLQSTCSTAANTNARRVISLENPQVGQQINNLEVFDDFGTSTYRGLRLSAQRRAVNGVSISGNYTWSYCFGHTMIENQNQFASGPTKPGDLTFDRGNCRQNRTHIANLTVGYHTPEFVSPILRILASSWRVSGIFSTSSGTWLTVTTGRDTALNGQLAQRVNQIGDDVYGVKTLDSYLNRAAFVEPAPGAFGNHVRNSIAGPGQWNIDLALSRLLSVANGQTVELRVEAFNLTNHFNWGNPTTTPTSGVANFLTGTFGRITSQATPPRIMQFGVKYGF